MKIKEVRAKSKLSQSEFAEKFGIPVRTLQKWEQEAADPLPYLISLIQGEIDLEEYIKVEQYYLKQHPEFKVVTKRNYKNVDKIHPIQQDFVGKIVETLSSEPIVKKIVVFGSSVTSRCTYDSDIDLYVDLSEDKNVKKYDVDVPVDYWTNFSIEPAMLDEVKKNGVVVYDRQ